MRRSVPAARRRAEVVASMTGGGGRRDCARVPLGVQVPPALNRDHSRRSPPTASSSASRIRLRGGGRRRAARQPRPMPARCSAIARASAPGHVRIFADIRKSTALRHHRRRRHRRDDGGANRRRRRRCPDRNGDGRTDVDRRPRGGPPGHAPAPARRFGRHPDSLAALLAHADGVIVVRGSSARRTLDDGRRRRRGGDGDGGIARDRKPASVVGARPSGWIRPHPVLRPARRESPPYTPSMLVWISGRIVPAESATVSILDRGFLFGDGVGRAVRYFSGVGVRSSITSPGSSAATAASSASRGARNRDDRRRLMQTSSFRTGQRLPSGHPRHGRDAPSTSLPRR